MALTLNVIIFEIRTVHSKLLSKRISFSTVERSGQKRVDNEGRWRRKARRAIKLNQKKQFSLMEKFSF